MFAYSGDIKVVQFYDLTNAQSVRQVGSNEKYTLVGDIISESNYHNGMYLPQTGSKVRFDSGKYNGIYEVVELVFCDATKLLRIKVIKV